jgi:hypothetical protein
LDEVDEVLALYDGPIRGGVSPVILDLVDASALLWRLQLRGVELGDRWSALAERWASVAEAGRYAFNDFHAMMAFACSGRTGEAEALLETQRAAMAGDDDNADFTRDVGHAVARAIGAFVQGQYGETVRLLRPVRNRAHRFGGSHAQRDVIDLTLIEAAARAGEIRLADALLAERTDARGDSAPARRHPAFRARPAREKVAFAGP